MRREGRIAGPRILGDLSKCFFLNALRQVPRVLVLVNFDPNALRLERVLLQLANVWLDAVQQFAHDQFFSSRTNTDRAWASSPSTLARAAICAVLASSSFAVNLTRLVLLIKSYTLRADEN